MCFRKDRLAQFGSASPRRCDSHKQIAARAIYHTETKDCNGILSYRELEIGIIHENTVTQEFPLQHFVCFQLCWRLCVRCEYNIVCLERQQLESVLIRSPPRHHQVSTGAINPSIGHKDPWTITFPGFKHYMQSEQKAKSVTEWMPDRDLCSFWFFSLWADVKIFSSVL